VFLLALVGFLRADSPSSPVYPGAEWATRSPAHAGLKDSALRQDDFQMALFWDALFLGVYGAKPDEVEVRVFHPLLTTPLGCQDNPSLHALGAELTGRVGISLRDHCRFGFLYLREGRWPAGPNGSLIPLLEPDHIRLATRSPLPLSLPRTTGLVAQMIPGQRTIGSRRIPDNQTDHFGCYSWLWRVNGVRASGKRLWPDASADAFAALGHEHGKRGLLVIPSLSLVLAWNDTSLDRRAWANPVNDSHPLNEALRLLVSACQP